MEDWTTKIMKNNNDKNLGYLTDSKIIKGLYTTIDTNKIKKNCELINIEAENRNGIYQIRISKRSNQIILTITIGNCVFLQFLIKHNLCIESLYRLKNDYISLEEKEIITKAYRLTKVF